MVTAIDLLPFVLILVFVAVWADLTSRVGADLTLSHIEVRMWLPTTWLIWLASIFVGGVVGEWASVLIGTAWR